MRNLRTVQVKERYFLECSFDDGSVKMADIKPYLKSEAFRPLTDVMIFKRVINNRNYVSWPNEEVDLSADTLWHIGKVVH
jgi:hypothetical protein